MTDVRIEESGDGYRIGNDRIVIDIGQDLSVRATLMIADEPVTLCHRSPGPSATVVTGGREIDGYVLAGPPQSRAIESCFGPATAVSVRGAAPLDGGAELTQELVLEFCQKYPQSVIVRASYSIDSGQAPIEKIVGLRLVLDAEGAGGDGPHDFWSFNGGGSVREQFIVPVTDDFSCDNGLGLSNQGYGGGVPLVDVWGRRCGLAVAHVDPMYRIADMPLRVLPDGRVSLAIEWPPHEPTVLSPGSPCLALPLMLSVHEGDFFDPLADYSSMLADQGVEIPCEGDGEAHEPAWCSWGYHADCTRDQIREVLPMLKRMGIRWITIDDGWFDSVGDWMPRNSLYGEQSIKDFVTELHDQGFKVQLWTIPGLADGDPDLDTWTRKYASALTEYWKHKFHALSNVYRDHSDWFVLDADGDPSFSKRGNYFFCPTQDDAIEYHRLFTELMIDEWGFDGFKQDAVYICPPCHNPAHGHDRPQEAVEQHYKILKVIYETTKRLKPDAVVQSCPCGVPPTHSWLAYQNQPVTSDPRSSLECRLNTKMFKALVGPNAPVFADHVEITDDKRDFATQLGCGAVLSTRFTLLGFDKAMMLEGAGERAYGEWTSDSEELWTKWLGLARTKQLSKGEYRNLYTVGFDFPEAHAISRDGRMYYAFYADTFDGELELRGLGAGVHRVVDYENDVDAGEVTGPTGRLKATFKGHLLLECTPAAK